MAFSNVLVIVINELRDTTLLRPYRIVAGHGRGVIWAVAAGPLG